jgi:hypothetical protein
MSESNSGEDDPIADLRNALGPSATQNNLNQQQAIAIAEALEAGEREREEIIEQQAETQEHLERKSIGDDAILAEAAKVLINERGSSRDKLARAIEDEEDQRGSAIAGGQGEHSDSESTTGEASTPTPSQTSLTREMLTTIVSKRVPIQYATCAGLLFLAFALSDPLFGLLSLFLVIATAMHYDKW